MLLFLSIVQIILLFFEKMLIYKLVYVLVSRVDDEATVFGKSTFYVNLYIRSSFDHWNGQAPKNKFLTDELPIFPIMVQACEFFFFIWL